MSFVCVIIIELRTRASWLTSRVNQKTGEGMINTLFTDTTLTNDVTELLTTLKRSGTQLSMATDSLRTVIYNVQHGQGPAGLIVADTVARNSLVRSLKSIEQGTYRFNQNMEAMQSNFLFKGYFKKQEKKNSSK